MRKILIGLLMALTGFASYAQEDSTDTSPWSIGTITNYDIILHRYNRLPASESSYAHDGLFNFTAGVRMQYQLKDELALRFGVAYARKDYNEQYYCDECDAVILPQPSEVKLRYIDLPVTARYLLRPGKLSLFAEGGVRGSFLVQAWKTYYYGELRPPQTFIVGQDYKSFSLSGTVGLHANFRASNRFSIDLGLSLTKPFYSPTASTELNWWEFNIQTGFNYHF